MRPRSLGVRGSPSASAACPPQPWQICLRVNGAKAAYPPPREFGAEAVVRITGLRGAHMDTYWQRTPSVH